MLKLPTSDVNPFLKEQRIMNGEDKILGSFQFGMRTPTKYLSFFEPFQEFLVSVAPEIKTNPMYAAWHLRQSMGNGRMTILDNRYRDQPDLAMKGEELAEAAFMGGAALVVGPDYSENRELTVKETKRFAQEYEQDFDTIGVVQGETVGELVKCFVELQDSSVKLIAFPESSLRLQAIRDLADGKLLESSPVYILLGFRSFQELFQISALGSWMWMLETDQPIKAALNNIELMNDYKPIDNHHDYDLELSDSHLYCATLNVAKLKAMLPSIPEKEEVSHQSGEDN